MLNTFTTHAWTRPGTPGELLELSKSRLIQDPPEWGTRTGLTRGAYDRDLARQPDLEIWKFGIARSTRRPDPELLKAEVGRLLAHAGRRPDRKARKLAREEALEILLPDSRPRRTFRPIWASPDLLLYGGTSEADLDALYIGLLDSQGQTGLRSLFEPWSVWNSEGPALLGYEDAPPGGLFLLWLMAMAERGSWLPYEDRELQWVVGSGTILMENELGATSRTMRVQGAQPSRSPEIREAILSGKLPQRLPLELGLSDKPGTRPLACSLVLDRELAVRGFKTSEPSEEPGEQWTSRQDLSMCLLYIQRAFLCKLGVQGVLDQYLEDLRDLR